LIIIVAKKALEFRGLALTGVIQTFGGSTIGVIA